MTARPDLSLGAIRVWQRNRDAALMLWKTEIFTFVTEPYLVIVALGLGLGQFVQLDNGQDYVVFIAPGLLSMFPMFSAVFECAWGSYVRLEMQGTYKAMLATPVSIDDVITGEILSGTTRSVIAAVWNLIVCLSLTPWLHMVSSPWALAIVPLAVLPGLLFAALSICFASIARAMSQFSYFFSLVVNPMFWFSGAFFPFDTLPKWARVLGWFVPLSHATELYRGLLHGDLERGMIADIAWLAIGSAFFYWLALIGMRKRLIE